MLELGDNRWVQTLLFFWPRLRASDGTKNTEHVQEIGRKEANAANYTKFRAGYRIFRSQCKMKMWGSLLDD